MTFHPSGEYAYVINEPGFDHDRLCYDEPRGALETIQTITTLPEDSRARAIRRMCTSQDGRFLYGSNCGHDSIVTMPSTPPPVLTVVGHTSTLRVPGNFNIDPTGRWMGVANQNTNTCHLPHRRCPAC